MWNPTPRHLAPASKDCGALLPSYVPETAPLSRAPRSSQAAAYARLGALYDIRGDLESAERMLERATELHAAAKPVASNELALCYSNLSLLYAHRGESKRSLAMARQAYSLNAGNPARRPVAVAYGCLGLAYLTDGDDAEAESFHRGCLEVNARLGNVREMAAACINLGLIARRRGEEEAARRFWRRARDLYVGEDKLIQAWRIEGWLGALGETS